MKSRMRLAYSDEIVTFLQTTYDENTNGKLWTLVKLGTSQFPVL